MFARLFRRRPVQRDRPSPALAVERRPDLPLSAPGPEPVGPPEVVRALLTMRALDVLGHRDPVRTTTLAAQAVALDLGGPATVALAAHYPEDDPGLLETALIACLAELGWRTASMSFEEAAVHVTRGRAAQLLVHNTDGRSVARWVQDHLAWDERVRSAVFSDFVELNWQYDEFDEGLQRDVPDARRTAAAFLEGTTPVSDRWRQR